VATLPAAVFLSALATEVTRPRFKSPQRAERSLKSARKHRRALAWPRARRLCPGTAKWAVLAAAFRTKYGVLTATGGPPGHRFKHLFGHFSTTALPAKTRPAKNGEKARPQLEIVLHSYRSLLDMEKKENSRVIY
jgi:hypothetical protein